MANKTTGRFETREELVERVVLLDMQGAMSMESIGKSCGVSQGTVNSILKSEEAKAFQEQAAEQIVNTGMQAVSNLVSDEGEVRKNLDRVQSGGDTYQVDLIGSNPQFQKFEIAKRVAHTLANSNLVPDAYKGRPNDCFVAINMGAELGMEPFQSIQSIAVIDGKPCLYGDGLIGVVRASSLCEWIEETVSEDGRTATCRTQRKGDPNPISATYTIEDAVQAGIHTKFNWKKHPKRMLQMRARAFCLRDAYPDLLKGLGVVEEMQDHDNTPPVINQYELPQSAAHLVTPAGPSEAPGTPTLAEVERAIHQSDSIEELLAASNLAKRLNEADQKTARVVYKRHRDLLLEGTDG